MLQHARSVVTFSVNCETLGEVKPKTCDWWQVPAGNSEVIHYRANCECGNENVGSSIPHAHNARAQNA
jgi:hypothetical protein